MSAPLSLTQTLTLTVGAGLLTARGTPDGGGGWVVDVETLLQTARGNRYHVPRGDASSAMQISIEHADGSPFEVSIANVADALSDDGGDPAVGTVTSSVLQIPPGQSYTTGMLRRATGVHYVTVKRESGTAAPTTEIRVTLVYR